MQQYEREHFLRKAEPGRPPAYLAYLDEIEPPIVKTGFYGGLPKLLFKSAGKADDPSRLAVDAFVQQCLPLVLANTDRGPNIDVDVLDTVQKEIAPHRFRTRIGTYSFCVPPINEDENNPAAMARALAVAMPVLTADMTYLPHTQLWCDFGISVGKKPELPPQDMMVSFFDNPFRSNSAPSQC